MSTIGTQLNLQQCMARDSELWVTLGLSGELMAQLRARAQFFADEGHWERALIMLEMLAELDREDRLTCILTADVLVELGRSLEAEAHLQHVLAQDADNLDALAGIVRVYLARASIGEAAATLGRIQKLDPEFRTSGAQRALLCARHVSNTNRACPQGN